MKRRPTRKPFESLLGQPLEQGFGPQQKQWQRAIEEEQRVYFMQDGAEGPIKIGIGVVPRQRRSGVQTGNPRPVRLIGSIPGGKQLEDQLHARFDHLHIQGEWYQPAQELLDYIKDALGVEEL